jgi:hypothetical protein
MPLERHQGPHRHVHRAQLLGAAEFGQVDDEAGGQHFGAKLTQEFHRRFRRAASGDQIVDQYHALAFDQRVGMHLDLVFAILQHVRDADALVRQLALLADRNETGRHLMRHRAAEDEAARLDAGDLVDLHAGPRLHQFVDGAAEGARVAEQRGDVAEHDAGLRVIRDRADRSAQVVFIHWLGHRLHSAFPALVVTLAYGL